MLEAVTKLQTACACGDPTKWVLNENRVITVCPGQFDCSFHPYLNFASPGNAHYGLAYVLLYI